MSILIKGMEMPKSCLKCQLERRQDTAYDYEFRCCPVTGEQTNHYRYERHPNCPLVPIPPHGRLIDADALETDLKRQCKEVFRADAVSPDDYWITRNQAYNENLWKTWCESFYDYLKTRPIIIPAEEGER